MITPKELGEYGRDIFLYHGFITRNGYKQLSDLIDAEEHKHEDVCLILSTTGGDPDAAYRIARALKHYYAKLDVLIPGLCKSAGTLLAIGGDRLVFGDRGELGPLDIQLSKPDEMFESMSGLDIIQAISAIESSALRAFRRYLVDIRSGSGIRTKMAAEIAVQLAEKCFAPMAAKIDPLTLGEHQRAMQIAINYGERLNEKSKNLKDEALDKLVGDYPCHGFVIDRREARSLFKNIVKPSEVVAGSNTVEKMFSLADIWISKFDISSSPIVLDFKEIAMLSSKEEKEHENYKDSGDNKINSSEDEHSSRDNEQTVHSSSED